MPKVGTTLVSPLCLIDTHTPEALDNYIKEVTQLDPDNANFVSYLQDVKQALANIQGRHGFAWANCIVRAMGGTLSFNLATPGPLPLFGSKSIKGSGPSNATLNAQFCTNAPITEGRGTYKLWIRGAGRSGIWGREEATIKIELHSSNGQVDTIEGTGGADILGGSSLVEQPWEGTWTTVSTPFNA
ncbi:hypothetical protein AB1N83_010195 [Pleurotus pulmonarius]